MVNIDKNNARGDARFLLTPNLSISWQGLILFYFCTCLVALTVGIFFLLQGLWLILPFSGMEMLALGLALYLTSLKAHQRQVITIEENRVRVEKGARNPDQSWEFDKVWVRVFNEFNTGSNKGRRLELGSHGIFVEIGEFLNNIEKDELAFELKDCIIRA